MIWFRLPFLFFLLLYAFGCSAQQAQKQNLAEQVSQLAKQEIKDRYIPSLAIGVVKDGNIVISQAHGYANVENRKLATNSTVYQLGSVTKMFTGHLLSQFINEQKIALTDTLATYFPKIEDFPNGPNGSAITIRHIATHSAGLPRYPENLERVDPDPIKGFTTEQLLSAIETTTIDSTSWEQYDYSNFGYGVLGTALENMTDQPLGQILDERFFSPFQMHQSSLIYTKDVAERLAVPYLQVGPLKRTEHWDMGTLSAAGNIFSSVDDMNKFMVQLLNQNEVYKIQTKEYLKINETWNYGLGCFVINSEKWDTKIIYHGGDIDGYASSLTLYPEYQLGIVILSNYGEGQVIGEIFTEINNVITETFLTITDK